MSTPAGVQITAAIRGLEVRLTHGPSGAMLATEPPKDNGGTGASFSPTDLVGAALASCALTTLALIAARESLDFGDAQARVVKQMVGPPRRIGALRLEFVLPDSIRAAHRPRLEEIARTCPVALSLHPDVQVQIEFRWVRSL